jgi:hypothetical protein
MGAYSFLVSIRVITRSISKSNRIAYHKLIVINVSLFGQILSTFVVHSSISCLLQLLMFASSCSQD